ncbi:MAG: hypothetical protein M0P31_04750 [Solirubrobacteraceae bacterium]|nr:hypothetical protein [Solirubrobacteraceae bacterium]
MTNDPNVTPKRDVPLWSETRWNGCWNPDLGVGVYLHAGRFRRDLDLWWAQVVAYLPDGGLCVQRLWGRNAADAGVTLGGLDLRMTDAGWTATYDGVGELTDTAAMARGVRGSSAPSRSFRIDLEATAVTAPWDQRPEGDDVPLHASDAHVQQAFTSRGTVTVDGEALSLDGIGFKDHSSGRRDFGPWRSHEFVMAVGPEWTAHLISMAAPDGTAMPPMGALITRDGAHEAITRFATEPLGDAAGGPTTGRLTFETDTGRRGDYAVEVRHAAPLSITEDNDNMNGVNWEIEGDPVVLIEGNARLTADDGAVVHAFHERTMRRSLLPRP